MHIKNSLYVNLITAGCILLCSCSSGKGESGSAELTTAAHVQTTSHTTLATQETTVSDTKTSTNTTTVSTNDHKSRFAERRQLLAQTDVWSEEFVEKRIGEKLESLRTVFPDGYYWNSNDSSSVNDSDPKELMISSKKCSHSSAGKTSCNKYSGVLSNYFSYGPYNIQCLGFANMFSDILYGKNAGILEFTDYDALEVGDTARLLNYSHSVVVIGKNDEYITVAECNSDYEHCEIKWGRQIKRYALREGTARFFKRSP